MLISILGNWGSGKTLFLAYLSTKLKRDIYSNFKLKVKNYKKLEIIDLMKLPNNIEVYIDEGYTWLESRVSSKALNRYLSYILLQSRKRTINIYITMQLFSTIDLRFREQSNIIIFCKKKDEGFEYKVFNRDNGYISIFMFPLNKAKEYYDIYDTYEIVEPYEKNKLEFQLLQSYPKLLFDTSKKIAIKIKDKIQNNKYTHQNIKIALISNGFDKNYEPYVYAYFHSNKK